MSRTESTIIALFLLIACPFSFFVMAWWASAGLSLAEVVPVPVSGIIAISFAALAVGTAVTVVNLKRWLGAFYAMDRILTVPVYLFWSVVAVGLLMGLPAGNLILGSLAGLYVGRRQHHAGSGAAVFRQDARRAGTFTAAVIGCVSLAMGVLAVHDQHSMQAILAIAGMAPLAATTARRILLVAAAVPVLVAAQYGLTLLTASWGFRLGRADA